MKKFSILLLSILFIGISNVNAQTEDADKKASEIDQVIVQLADKEVKECAKTAKACDNTCEKKKNGTCCEGKKSDSKCSNNKKNSFNFNKSNSYSAKKSSSCCKSKEKKECSSSKETKGISPSNPIEKTAKK